MRAALLGLVVVIAACLGLVDGRERSLRGRTLKLFEPTHEWQEIQDDVELPAGLWIRINLSTGKKEARLLD
ncbi:hypothetical protein AC1031_011079 [Aphanomyces cochlioides]|nr:hypothetical protein AC1031_011079 [Aphanomyces cochlioides]